MGELRPTVGTSTIEIQEGAKTTLSLEAPGVYDAEKQLSPDEVVALKERLKANDFALISLPAKVCAHIATEIMTFGGSDYDTAEDAHQALGEDAVPLIGEGGEFADEREFGKTVAELSVSWYKCLKMAIEMPGSDWPEGMTPPATFAEALKEIDADTAAQAEQNG